MIHFRCVTLVFVALFSVALCRPAHAVDDSRRLLTLLEQMESSYSRIQDYTAVFQKQERVGPKLLGKESIQVKFQKPFKVYMKWMQGQSKEALYVDGQNSNKVLAHCEGLLGLLTFAFNPRDPRLMDDNRHPITEIGFGFIIEMMRRDFPIAVERNELHILSIKDENFEGRPTMRVEAQFTPQDGRQYYTSRMVCNIDKEHMLPIGVTCYDDKGDLQEQYGYKDLRVNVGLSAMDFSKANKEYRF